MSNQSGNVTVTPLALFGLSSLFPRALGVLEVLNNQQKGKTALSPSLLNGMDLVQFL